MARAHPIQSGFNAGEFSPRMAARLDFEKYPRAGSIFENLLIFEQGGFTRRPGTRFVAETRNNAPARLMRFEFSVSQAYVLEFTSHALRFFHKGGRIETQTVNAQIRNGTFAQGSQAWTLGKATIKNQTLNQGEEQLTSKVLELAKGGHASQEIAINHKGISHVLCLRIHGSAATAAIRVKISDKQPNKILVSDRILRPGTHCLAFSPSENAAVIRFEQSTGTPRLGDISIFTQGPIEIPTPYGEDALFEIMSTQSADMLYLFHKDYPPHKLIRYGNASWSLEEVFFNDGPYKDEELDQPAIQVDKKTGSANVIADKDLFAAKDIGRLLRIKHNDHWGYGVITDFINTKKVKIDILRQCSSTSKTSEWRLGSFSYRDGWPCCGCFYEQRLWVAGTKRDIQSLWASQTADFENMEPDSIPAGEKKKKTRQVEDDDALSYTLSADQINAIRWMSAGHTLIIGTSGGEWVAQAGSANGGEVITPFNLRLTRQTTHGSAAIAPLRVGSTIVFLQRAGRKLHEFNYIGDYNSYLAPDLTILADHITRPRIIDLGYQQEPNSIIWSVRGDGALLSLSYKSDQNVTAWSRHWLAGTSEGEKGKVESLATIPGAEYWNDPISVQAVARDVVWLVVKRTIKGKTKRYVEYIEAILESGVDQSRAFYVDSGVTKEVTTNQEPIRQVDGLDHLEGETVVALVDGAVHTATKVEAGKINLQFPGHRIHVGLPYPFQWRSLKLDSGGRAGTAIGKRKRIHSLSLILLDSLGGKIGPDDDHLQILSYRNTQDKMDQAIPLFTGEKQVTFGGNWQRDTRILITGEDPLPFTLLAITPEITTHDIL